MTRGPARERLSAENVFLLEPVDYASLVWLLDRCELVLTDSGGIQEEAPALGKPVLIIWGEADQIIPVAHARAYTGKAQVEVIAGKGHMVQMEAANEVNQLIKQFLS